MKQPRECEIVASAVPARIKASEVWAVFLLLAAMVGLLATIWNYTAPLRVKP